MNSETIFLKNNYNLELDSTLLKNTCYYWISGTLYSIEYMNYKTYVYMFNEFHSNSTVRNSLICI